MTNELSQCTVPPLGWSCSRVRGHDGPCAATPIPDGADREALADAERRIKALLDRIPDSDAVTVAKIDQRALLAEYDRMRAELDRRRTADTGPSQVDVLREDVHKALMEGGQQCGALCDDVSDYLVECGWRHPEIDHEPAAAASGSGGTAPDPVGSATRAEIVHQLRKVAAGRQEYADNIGPDATGIPAEMRDLLMQEAGMFRAAARVAEGDLLTAMNLLPSWRWTDDMLEVLGRETPTTPTEETDRG